jgi:hypothetical protein
MKAFYNRFEDWVNEYVQVRRIDIIIALSFILGGIYSYYSGGWIVLLQYAALFVFILICAMWIWRRD